jgi:hypothetical protein
MDPYAPGYAAVKATPVSTHYPSTDLVASRTLLLLQDANAVCHRARKVPEGGYCQGRGWMD